MNGWTLFYTNNRLTERTRKGENAVISLNKVLLIGKVGTEPKMKITKNGQRIVTFKLITSSSWTDTKSGETQTKPEWHCVAAFGKVADKAQDSLKQDSMVYIEGTIQTRKVPYVTPDGEDVFKQVTEIRALDIMLLNGTEALVPDNIGNTYGYYDDDDI